jgi:sec-independent protein translocase protein TatA
MMNALIGMPQGAEWLVILAIVVLVFGAAKLPDLARGTGQALRIFKNETKGLKDDDEAPKAEDSRPSELPPINSVDESRTDTTLQDRQTDNHNG